MRGAVRGRDRGRRRGDHGARAGNKNTFFSTRVEGQQESISGDGEEGFVLEDRESIHGASESSSDSDDDAQTDTVLPYNTLLQALNANIQRDEPQRKKRKTEQVEVVLGEQEKASKHDSDNAEELKELESPGTDDIEGNEIEEENDPFLKHLVSPDDDALEKGIQAAKTNEWSTQKLRKQRAWTQILKFPSISDTDITFPSGTVSNIGDLALKERLKRPAQRRLPSLDELTSELAYPIFHYRDVLFPYRTLENAKSLRELTSLHALNHVLKTRDRVIKDNARLAKQDSEEDLDLRDQGFTRPKVLILLPTRRSCVNYIDTFIALCEPEQQENRKRFQDSFAAGEPVSEDKPQDFRELFDGNDDDMFRLGLKFTRKTFKYFAQFYNSDVIFASPLGLRMALGADDPKKQDNDFLSSIEVVVVDQADAMLMQNWDHIDYIFEHLNLQPKEAHGCDFSRVRNWYLDGNAKYLRQTILLSGFNFPSLNRLYTHHMSNVSGKVKYAREVEGAMIDLGVSIKQTFSRFDFSSAVTEPDNRFKYFSTAVVPSLLKNSRRGAAEGQGVLIYLPSYADFVRVRNYLASSSATQEISFGSISEYTSVQDVTRARSHFFSGRHSVLLYTERAHHFRRYHLKGVKRVILYGLPENPTFYQEVAGGFLSDSITAAKLDARDASVRALFSKLDILKLERIVGTSRYLSMLREKRGDTFDFV